MPHQCTNCGKTFPDGSKEMLSGCPQCGGNKFQFRPSGSLTEEERAEVASVESGAAADTDSEPSDVEPTAPDSGPEPDTSSDVSVSETAAKASEAVRDWVGFGETSTDERKAESASDSTSTIDDATTVDDEGAEDRAQASARSEVVSTDELSAAARDVDESSSEPERRPESEEPPGSEEQPESEKRSEPGKQPKSSPSEDRPASEAQSAPGDQPASEDQRPSENQSTLEDTSTGTPTPPADADGEVVQEPSTTDDPPGLQELREELNEQFESIKIINPGQYELNLMGLYDREEYIISLQEDGRYVIEVPDTWRDEE